MTDSPLPYTVFRGPDSTAAEFELDSYLMHRKTTRCLCCSSESTTSEVFEVQIHRARRIRRLVPARKILPGFPLGLSTLQVREQPACYVCFDRWPQEPAGPQYATEDEWRQTLRRKYATPSAETKVETPKGPDLADL